VSVQLLFKASWNQLSVLSCCSPLADFITKSLYTSLKLSRGEFVATWCLCTSSTSHSAKSSVMSSQPSS
jgi:hypothetical protein